MKYTLITLLIASLTCSCSNSPTKAYFSGEIVNPNMDYVYLHHNNERIDSAELSENNRFSFEITDLKEGLYHFDHKEYQYIILEKGDSLLMRLNTLDFDESLVYSGNGAAKNNFLIDVFLIYEDEEKVVNDFSELPPKEFLFKIDSLKKMKEELLTDINASDPLSPMAMHIANKAIDYRYFTDMEEYPFIHKRKSGSKTIPKLPKNFYSFRNQVDYNDTLLTYYRPYFNYLITHFNNLAYTGCAKKCEDVDNLEKSLHYSIHKLKLINDKVAENKTIRDNLNRNVAFTYLLGDNSVDNNEKFIDSFNKYASDNQHIEEVTDFYKNVQNLQKGLTLPSIRLVDMEGNKITIDSTAYEKNTVFYFWDINQKNHRVNVLNRIAKLKEEYPEYDYIGINVNEDRDEWVKNLLHLTENGETLTQYQTDDIDELLATLVIKSLNKIIIVDKNGKIIEGFGNIYHRKELENSLRNRLN
ncbi:TlpA family protein disulfide reductase [Galbibacter mesophilus]|uniref:TlpA family protein disulfide reductase n=1 Tax=Galbibacter mesophilus TaxID=379069 RepID=UPI00191ECAC6|nr:thioredoxin-like domain-containing protein [Galbibacter mesophilus]MCM5663344.1 thioredoxin family protein [Galbibacter mesophilus]